MMHTVLCVDLANWISLSGMHHILQFIIINYSELYFFVQYYMAVYRLCTVLCIMGTASEVH